MTLDLRDGCYVRLRNGRIAGPLRDRKHENSSWPWGLRCKTCHSELYRTCWRPNGSAASYEPHPPHLSPDHPLDIIEVIDGEAALLETVLQRIEEYRRFRSAPPEDLALAKIIIKVVQNWPDPPRD